MKIKLVDQDYTTRGGMRWQIGVTNRATGKQRKLCSDGVLHYYDSAELAVFMNRIHANIKDPIALEVKGRQVVTEGLKSGAKSLTPIRVIELPRPTIVNHVAFGILCSLELAQSDEFRYWAENWLNGSDRTSAAAVAEADAAAWAAARTAARTATEAGNSSIDFVKIARKAMEVK